MKKEFIKKLSDFLIENVPYFSDIKNLVYVKDDSGMEWLYCNYISHSQKRIDITADSEKAILKDFINHLEESDWIIPVDEKIFFSN